MSRYKAVIFDLWGTLVDELRYPEANRLVYQQKIHESADLLGDVSVMVSPDRGRLGRLGAWSGPSHRSKRR